MWCNIHRPIREGSKKREGYKYVAARIKFWLKRFLDDNGFDDGTRDEEKTVDEVN